MIIIMIIQNYFKLNISEVLWHIFILLHQYFIYIIILIKMYYLSIVD